MARNHAFSAEELLTGLGAQGPFPFSLRPLFSEPHDFARMVRVFKHLIFLAYSPCEIRTFGTRLGWATGTGVESPGGRGHCRLVGTEACSGTHSDECPGPCRVAARPMKRCR
jgi:hypothetical protein